ncbi:MAG: DUF2341 domain-containing protein, partial [Candidatus Kariarchaeaceae archaeon]
MKSKRIFHNWILFFVLSVNFFVTGFVIGGNVFNTDQNELNSSDEYEIDLEGEIASVLIEEDSISKLYQNNIHSSDFQSNHNQIQISDGQSNSIKKRTGSNFLILNEGQPWSSATSGYKYRKAIRIESGKVSGTSSLTDYPLLINLYDEDLQDFTRSDGNDIVFTDYSGTKLDHEIELFDKNYSLTQAHLVTWVKIPSLSSTTDTTLFMYFNKPSQSSVEENPSSVWDSSYKAIWHMAEDPGSSNLLDSTSNSNDGLMQGAMDSNDLIPGISGNAIDFDGVNDFYNVTHSSSLDITGNTITMEGWVYFDSLPVADDTPLMVKATSENVERYMLGVDGGSNPSLLNHRVTTGNGHYRYDTGSIYAQEWTYLVAIYDGSKPASTAFSAYVNGELVSESYADGDILTSTSSLLIGKRTTSSRWFEGNIDELRLSDNVRSEDYVKTAYNNLNNPDWFYSISAKHSQRFWPQEDFSFRKNVTISNSVVSGSSELIDFPYLLELTDEDLKYKTLASGYDILFTDQNGAPYDHEIEIFDQSSGYLRVWIRIPTFSATSDTKLVMYFGNPNAITSNENVGAVWDDNYVAVWHMNNDPSGPSPQILDSTGNNWDGSYAFNTFTADDLVNGTIYFDDSNDGFNVGNINSNSWDQLTLQGWINPFNSEYDKILTKENTTGSGGPYSWYLGRNSGNTYYRITRDGGSSYTMNVAAGIQNNEWNSLAFTWDGTITSNQMVGYKDGSIVNTRSTGTSTYTIHYTAYDVYLGITGYSGNDVGGYLDEIRISDIVRSPDWLATEYNNQIDPTGYVTTESEENFVNIFDYRKQITIDSTQVSGSSELVDFPLYFDFYDSDIRTKTQSNGEDIYFTDNNGTKLLHELLEYSDNGSHIHLKTWIRINRIQPDADTIIYMYYGNDDIENQEPVYGIGQGVYSALYHLDETASDGGTSTIHSDSANGYDGNQNG